MAINFSIHSILEENRTFLKFFQKFLLNVNFFVSLVMYHLMWLSDTTVKVLENLIFTFVHFSFLLPRGKKRSSCWGTAKKRYYDCLSFSVVRTIIKQSKTKNISVSFAQEWKRKCALQLFHCSSITYLMNISWDQALSRPLCKAAAIPGQTGISGPCMLLRS